MSPTAKALLVELFAELLATTPEIDYEVAKIYAKPARCTDDFRAIARKIREAKHDDLPDV